MGRLVMKSIIFGIRMVVTVLEASVIIQNLMPSLLV